MNQENFKSEDLDDAIASFPGWTRRIKEELKTFVPYEDELKKFREEFEKKIKETIPDENSRFSEEEISRIQQALDNLASRLAEVESNQKDSTKQINKIEAELSEAKENLKYFPKGVWYRTAGNKIIDMINSVVRSKEGKEFIFESAKKLLGPGD